MVLQSLLSKQIRYADEPGVAEQDKAVELPQYSIPLFDYPDMNIALGKKCETYKKNGVIHHWCYLTTDQSVNKIGLFEFPAHRYETCLERDSVEEIMESKLLPHLLLFQNARDSVLKAQQEQNAGTTLSTSGSYPIVSSGLPHETDSIDFHMFQCDTPLKDDTVTTDNDMSTLLGIEGIVMDKETGSFIDILAKGIYKQIHKTLEQTKDYLRGILADHLTEDVFETMKTMHDLIQEQIILSKEVSREFRTIMNEGKKQVKEMQHNQEVQELLTNMKARKAQLQEESHKFKNLQLLLAEKKYISSVNDFQAFKEVVKSKEYKSEPWVIPILERLMNVKVILLSPDMPQYLVTKRQTPFPMNEMLFNPKYYVMMEYKDNDYKLIEYQKRSVLSFGMIPHKVKEMVVMRGLERNGGMYTYIPMFEKYKQYSTTKDQKERENVEYVEELDESVLMIYKDTSSQWKPGEAVGEKMVFDDLLDWGVRLHRKDWRKKLDNRYCGKDGYFTLEDREWSSVNHYVAAMNIRHKEPEKYEKLTRNSKSGLSKMTIPSNYAHTDYLYTAQFAKFSQNSTLKALLLQTGRSELYEYLPGQAAIKMEMLMKARGLLHGGEPLVNPP